MRRFYTLPAMAALLATVAAVLPAFPQEQSGSPAANEVPSGTRFLVRLGATLATNQSKPGDSFTVTTLEPLVSADGTSLPPGAEIRGHIDKIVPAHKMGHARLWLTFDEIRTPDGWIPVVAMVDDVPGVHSIRVDYNHEGEIEMSADKRQEALEAAAAAALVGAAPGIAKHDTKDAAMGAGVAAVIAYMAAAELGQELTIKKDTKLELMLERSLFFGRTQVVRRRS